MATAVNKIVNTDGGADFIALNSAFSWYETNYASFVTSDIAAEISCDGDADDTTNAGITAITGNGNGLSIVSSNPHGGIFGGGYALTGGLNIATDYCDIEGLEIDNTSYTSINLAFSRTPGANQTNITSCLIMRDGQSSASYAVAGPQTNLNCKFVNTVISSVSRGTDLRGVATAEVYNCVFYMVSDQIGIVADAGLTCKNTYSGRESGSQEDFWTGGASPSGSNNMSSDSSASTDYTSSLTGYAPSDVFTDPANGDFTLKSGVAAIGAGVAISGLTTDIVGETWGTPPSIGVFEYVSTSPTYTETITTTVAAITSAEAQQQYADLMETLITSGASVSDTQTMVENIITLAQSESSVVDQLLTTISETVTSVAVSASQVDEAQSYVETVSTLAQSATEVEVLGEIVENIGTVATSLSSVTEQQQYYQGVATVATSSSSIEAVQAFIDEVATTAQSESTVLDVLVASGWLFEALELESALTTSINLQSSFTAELQLSSPLREFTT